MIFKRVRTTLGSHRLTPPGLDLKGELLGLRVSDQWLRLELAAHLIGGRRSFKLFVSDRVAQLVRAADS